MFRELKYAIDGVSGLKKLELGPFIRRTVQPGQECIRVIDAPYPQPVIGILGDSHDLTILNGELRNANKCIPTDIIDMESGVQCGDPQCTLAVFIERLNLVFDQGVGVMLNIPVDLEFVTVKPVESIVS